MLSIGVCVFSDMVFSGSSDGHINVYQCNTANTAQHRSVSGHPASIRPEALQLIARIPCAGYINSLSCAKSGRFLVAGVGQEHRAGRWMDNIKSARNGISIIELFAHTAD